MSRAVHPIMRFHLEELGLPLGFDDAVAGGEPSGHSEYSGCKALMLAVLEEGVRTFLYTRGRVREEAEYWINSRGQRSLFAFNVVCENLGLDPEAARTALRHMRTQVAGPAQRGGRSRPNVSRARRIIR
ncbi:MAG TPA: hypothetical protein VMT89_15065 [Candidatus Acidoferrales bacterium]|nr:hypothetical protein [Candidatus Acidoferrales bacterium]